METSNRNVAYAAKQTALTALGGRLRAARTSAGLTQQTVAERLGVSPQTVRNWETGRHEPTEQATEAPSLTVRHPIGTSQETDSGSFAPGTSITARTNTSRWNHTCSPTPETPQDSQ